MSETLSIRERIEIRICQVAATMTGVGDVFRFDSRGTQLAPLDCLVYMDDETASQGEAYGFTFKTLPFVVSVLSRQAEDVNESDSFVHNRWVSRIETALCALTTSGILFEPQGTNPETYVRLATDVQVTGVSSPPIENEQEDFYCSVAFEVTYRHDAANPTAFGTAVAAKTVTTLPTYSQKKLS